MSCLVIVSEGILCLKCLSFSLICSSWFTEFLTGYPSIDHTNSTKISTHSNKGVCSMPLEIASFVASRILIQYEINLVPHSSCVYLLHQTVIIELKKGPLSKFISCLDCNHHTNSIYNVSSLAKHSTVVSFHMVARDKSLTMFRAQESHVNAGCLPLEVTNKIGENSPW